LSVAKESAPVAAGSGRAIITSAFARTVDAAKSRQRMR